MDGNMWIRSSGARRRPRCAAACRWLAVATACLLLSACFGKATVMKEEAAALSDATRATVRQSREFYAKLGKARQNYFLVSVAGDANCRLERPIYLLPDATRDGGFRCLTPSEAAQRRACATTPPGAACPPGGVAAAFPQLQSFTPGDVEKSSALELVDVLSEYQGLLAQIVADPEFDATAKLTALQARANKFGSVLKLLDDSVPTLDFTSEINAIGKLVNLIHQAAVDQRDLKSLRKLLAGDDAKAFEAALESLALRYKNLDKPLLDGLARFSVEFERRQYNETAATLTPEQRLTRLRNWVDSSTATAAAAAAPDLLAPAFDALLKSQQTLRDAVVNEKYTDEQRRKIAQANLSQLKDWFKAVSGLISIF
jgi:hypothetical protein